MVFQSEIFNMFFSYEDGDIGRFSDLHWCTFHEQFSICEDHAKPLKLKENALVTSDPKFN